MVVWLSHVVDAMQHEAVQSSYPFVQNWDVVQGRGQAR